MMKKEAHERHEGKRLEGWGEWGPASGGGCAKRFGACSEAAGGSGGWGDVQNIKTYPHSNGGMGGDYDERDNRRRRILRRDVCGGLPPLEAARPGALGAPIA